MAGRVQTKPGEAARVARKGLSRAVDDLVNPPRARLIGPRPTDDDGAPLAPRDAWGTTTSGGSTGWCARTGRSSSG